MSALRRTVTRTRPGAAVGLLTVGLVGYAAAVLGCLTWAARAMLELAFAGGYFAHWQG